jgi:hypothetical protein
MKCVDLVLMKTRWERRQEIKKMKGRRSQAR